MLRWLSRLLVRLTSFFQLPWKKENQVALLDVDMEIKSENLPSVLESLNEQRLTGQYCDVTLLSADGIKFEAHKNYLAAGSEYFSKMLNSGLKESKAKVIEMKGFDGEALETILQYIYTGNIKVNFKNALRVLQAFDLMLLHKVVDDIDVRLSSRVAECMEEVLEIAANFARLPKSEKIVAQQILIMEDTNKRAKCIQKVNVEIMCEMVKEGGVKCNAFFPELLKWLIQNKSHVLVVCENMDFSVLGTTNLKGLVEFGLSALQDDVSLIFKKTLDVFISSRSGVIRHTVKNLRKMPPYEYSDQVTIANLCLTISTQGIGEKEERDGQIFYKSLGVYLYCNSGKNTHFKAWKCLVSCTFKLLSSTGITLEKEMQNISYPKENSAGLGFPYFVSWEDLFEEKNGYITDDSIVIEAHVVIESTSPTVGDGWSDAGVSKK